MTLEFDNEDGPGFWSWIVEHYNVDASIQNPLLDTYFFLRTADAKLVATISLVQDDRDIGKRYGIPGIWMGGANVKREERDRGLMRDAFGYLDAYVQSVVDSCEVEVPVNLFTTTPSILHLASAYQFQSKGRLAVEYFGIEEERFEKVYRPRVIL